MRTRWRSEEEGSDARSPNGNIDKQIKTAYKCSHWGISCRTPRPRLPIVARVSTLDLYFPSRPPLDPHLAFAPFGETRRLVLGRASLRPESLKQS
eukprot:697230-Prorocentrum_minimum.AAC.2